MVDTQTIESLKSLPVAERIQLVEDLWDSLALVQEGFDLSEAQQVELAHRLDALSQNQSPLLSWDEVKSGIVAGR
jgi:putative addiction module component (TIGR02574 family)